MEPRDTIGTVDFFHDRKGYGFIETDELEDDVFFHIEDQNNDIDIQEGDTVAFDVEQPDSGPRAINLTISKYNVSDDTLSSGTASPPSEGSGSAESSGSDTEVYDPSEDGDSSEPDTEIYNGMNEHEQNYCPKCGCDLIESPEANFCPNCGLDL